MKNTTVIVRGGLFDGGFSSDGGDTPGKLFAREGSKVIREGRKAKRKLFQWLESD